MKFAPSSRRKAKWQTHDGSLPHIANALKDELGHKIVNLSSGHAVILSPKHKVLASSMDAIEEKIAIHNFKDNLQFMEA